METNEGSLNTKIKQPGQPVFDRLTGWKEA